VDLVLEVGDAVVCKDVSGGMVVSGGNIAQAGENVMDALLDLLHAQVSQGLKLLLYPVLSY
jgi:hypothetical protein